MFIAIVKQKSSLFFFLHSKSQVGQLAETKSGKFRTGSRFWYFLNYSHVNIYPGSSSSKNVSKCLFSLLRFVFVLMNHRAEYPFCVCGLFWLFIYLYSCCSLAHQLFESHHLWTWWQLYEKNGNNHHTHNPMTKLLKEATITESLQMIVDAINYLISILCVSWDF